MLDPDSVRAAVKDADAVVHLANVVAGRPDVDSAAARKVNVAATRALGEAAAHAGVARFVHVSSIALYGDAAGEAIVTERTAYRPGRDLYAQTKVEGELALQGLDLPLVIVQPGHVYGPHDPGWTLIPLELIRKRRLILPGGGRAPMQPVYVTDLADGIIAALERGREGEAYIMAGPEKTTFRDYFLHLARMLGREAIPSVPVWAARAGAAVMEAASKVTGKPPPFTRDQVGYASREFIFDDSKAREELGYSPRVLVEEGMTRIQEWLRSEGRI